MEVIFRLLLALGIVVCSSVSMAANGGTHFEKIRLRLDIASIDDPALKKMATDAQNAVADTIGALSHGVLRKEEVAEKIGWVGSAPLLLAPDSSCAVGVGLITPSGRPIIRQTYAFMGGSAWKKEDNHSFSFLAEYNDVIIQDNIIFYRYYFEKSGADWRLSKQEVVSRKIVAVDCQGPRTGATSGDRDDILEP